MRPHIRTLFVFLFAGAVFLQSAQPAAASFEWYDWTGGYQLVRDSQDPSLGRGQDIRNAFYAVNEGYKYFRMELYGSPGEGANGYANMYAFFINKGEGGHYPEYSAPLVIDATPPTFPVDSYLAAFAKPTLGGGLQFTPDSGTFIGGDEYAFDLRYERNGKYLDWAVPEDQLPDSFTWMAATLKKGSWILLNSTAAVATPVPSAALLLGTGIICLVGLRRRSRPAA